MLHFEPFINAKLLCSLFLIISVAVMTAFFLKNIGNLNRHWHQIENKFHLPFFLTSIAYIKLCGELEWLKISQFGILNNQTIKNFFSTITSLIFIDLLGSFFVVYFFVNFERHSEREGLALGLACIFTYSFEINTLVIFTAMNIYFLPQTCLEDRFKDLDKFRMQVVVCLMALMHVLQYVLWMNPGPCYNCFN